MELNFKPNTNKIMVESMTYLFFLILMPALIISFYSYFFNFIYAVLAIMIGLTISFIILFITVQNAKNDRYHMDNKYLSRKKLFISEIREDVPVSQITNIDYSISWFWDKMFNTGSISIYTSGSNSSDLKFSSISDTVNIYDKINELLKNNKNLHLKNSKSEKHTETIKSELIEKIKPNAKIAAFLSFVSTLIITGYLTLSAFKTDFSIIIFLLIIFLFNIVSPTITYFAYKKKSYNFYSDKLEYYDGFFTLNKSTIPTERITNITEDRNLFDRIFGVSKIGIETAGSIGPEVIISYVTNGDKIVSNLKEELKKNGRN